MSLVRRSFAWSAASKYSQFLLVLTSNIVLARLLTPDQIGTYAVAAVLAGLAQTFRDMGIGAYLIQEPELDDAKIRTAFTLMTGLAWGLGLILGLVASPLAAFYGEPALAPVLRIQALAFLIIPFGAISLTLLRRAFRFGAVYVINVAAAVGHLVVGVGLALLGFGATSLAWAAVASMTVTALVAGLARGGRIAYRPGLRGARRILGFGGFVSASQLLGTLGRDIPELIIGKSMGMAPLAYFNKAMLPTTMFSEFVMGALNPVLLPAFTRQRDAGTVAPVLSHGVACLSALVIPPLVLLACLAEWAVYLLFGPQWGEAAAPMRLLALATAVWSLISVFPSVMTALGYPKALLQAQLIILPARVGLVVLALPFGLEAVALAWLASQCLATAVRLFQLNRYAGIAPAVVARAVAPAVSLGAGLALAVGLTVRWVGADVTTFNALIVLGTAGGALLLLWGLLLAWLDHPLFREALGGWRRLTVGAV